MVKISILTPCFNHEKYIKYYLQSVLEQSFQDFELIIVDDYSTDNSIQEIQKFNDSRIKLIKHEFNKGINATLNTAFENSNGGYIVLCASDDILEKNALEVIYQTFKDSDVDVIYPNISIIDENNVFQKKNRYSSKENIDILNHIFFKGNCLASVGMSIRTTFFKKIYPLDNSMCNHQDTKMHVELILNNSKILFLKEHLIQYRISSESASISARIDSTIIRENLEINFLMDSFLKIKDEKLLENIFKNEIEKTKIKPYGNTLEFFLGRMALESEDKFRKIWGYHKIMKFYNEINNVKILKEKYNFTFKDYLALVKLFKSEKFFKKYKKYKKISNILTYICLLFLIIIGVLLWLIF
ncbi:glycosyltransferase family 2 protein [Campylobacter sp. 2018MI35]|uniref:glycosyltransferase family 2 protein n=1 Tax=Campylobacter molothri TaxID=1032242 RepID=UPI00190489BE|nr:glycosyltransferase family A protein [Campylobacter sp. 2018MI35]MBK2001315.1 glycosyltransferase family 2 protein [Campylobacter sp. 2018MI35]